MRPDDPIVSHYLTHSLVMRLATISTKGTASLTPIWFVRVDGALVASTAATTVAARNIAVDPRVTVLLDGEGSGTSDYALRIRGMAEVHDGLPPMGVMARFARKYYAAPRGLRTELSHATLWRLRMRYYSQADAVWLAIEPASADLVRLPAPSASPIAPGRVPGTPTGPEEMCGPAAEQWSPRRESNP